MEGVKLGGREDGRGEGMGEKVDETSEQNLA